MGQDLPTDCGSSCGDLTATSWSQALGVSLLVVAAGVYVLLGLALVATQLPRREGKPSGDGKRPTAKLVSLTLAGAIVGAGVWFTFLQAFVIGQWCPLCMLAHGIGLGVASAVVWGFRKLGPRRIALSLGCGFALAGGLAGVQIIEHRQFKAEARAAAGQIPQAPLPFPGDGRGSSGETGETPTPPPEAPPETSPEARTAEAPKAPLPFPGDGRGSSGETTGGTPGPPDRAHSARLADSPPKQPPEWVSMQDIPGETPAPPTESRFTLLRGLWRVRSRPTRPGSRTSW
ncbi:MAG: vitamin K epoxide reductase family protein [Planctomycetota bacterium]